MSKPECDESNCNYIKCLSEDIRGLLKKHKATMWTSGCEDGIYGIEMNPKTFAKFLKSYDKLKANDIKALRTAPTYKEKI